MSCRPLPKAPSQAKCFGLLLDRVSVILTCIECPVHGLPAGKRIRCSRLDGPGVLLLGDAAHAVTPVFGQGANSALESCKVLGDVLQQAAGQLDEVPAMFTAARLADMHALYELDAKAYSFFRSATQLADTIT